jgi:hypothetical protein
VTKKSPRIPKSGLVKIVWRDAYTSFGWWSKDDNYESEEAIPTSVGWVLHGLKPGYLSLAGTVMDHGGVLHYNDISHIPSEMVISAEQIAP